MRLRGIPSPSCSTEVSLVHATSVVILAAGLFAAVPPEAAEVARPRVVINEIMYHPPDDRDDLQFVELYNPGAESADLSRWAFSKGIEFVFPNPSELPAGGYVVVCRDLAAFKQYYGPEPKVAGAFRGGLSHRGERLELSDAGGAVVEAVKYGAGALWPLGADGYGASLERICPIAPAGEAANWSSCALRPGERDGGTPGRRNTCFSPKPLPQFLEVKFGQAQAGHPLAVSATVSDAAGVESVALTWTVWQGENAPTWSQVAMQRQSGDAQRGIYAGSIPALPEERLIRFTVQAVSRSGAERWAPPKSEPRPTFTVATFANTNTARIPFLRLMTPGRAEGSNPQRRVGGMMMSGPQSTAGMRSSWRSAAIYLPPGGKEVRVFDHVQVRPRKGGVKVHFHKDRPFGEMTGINVIFEASARWVLAEPLAYTLYERAGVPSPETDHVRLWMGGQALGYHLLIEQPGKAFLRRHGRDANGNLYKLLWYGRGLVGQHEKKINPRSGHEDLLAVVEGLNGVSGMEQWNFIQEHFNVEEFINYYAVNMCIQNWDGFWNNYFAYHDPKPGGKWEVYPWDEDKTWGAYDGASRRYDWYEMPLTFGMNGDRSVGNRLFGNGPFGGVAWWRPPGHFSGPLLANPEFRKRFQNRLREICETVFTPEKMGPAIRSLEKRLEDEVVVRAGLHHRDAEGALEEFRNDIRSFHDQVVNRRKFILKQLGPAPAPSRGAS